MKLTITFFLLLFIFQAKGQSITKYYDYTWKECESNYARFFSVITKTDSGYTRYDYFIANKTLQMKGKYDDIDCKIPNGYFYYFHANEMLLSRGGYVHGKKDGLWLSYHVNGMMSDSALYKQGKVLGTSLSWHPNGFLKDSTVLNEKGSGVQVTWFDNGNPSSAGYLSDGEQPNGKWKYYHKNGEVSSVEVYNEGKLMDKTYFDENGKQISDTTSRDANASFPGGISAWQNYLSDKLYFPDQYKFTNGDKAVVAVTFSINEEGKVENVYASTPFHQAFDKIAENVIRKSPKWIPAKQHNRKVAYWVRQPVVFSQPE
ncbi:energy transducer TonB [Flavihumibacter profundi]|uniref:energy transducer TonB n=1 Tax=Flavihumibacter profundi TaxID=2716883 RepID=UPI001CC44B9C|nr:energy transducer TonB [Flavihumibacter profundi]MBZ5856814.1 energy transducer TonB [Flavihumibacter profundi]